MIVTKNAYETAAPLPHWAAPSSGALDSYLEQVGGVELLSRDREVEIAQRLEAGEAALYAGLVQVPAIVREVVGWGPRLASGAYRLRDVVGRFLASAP